jgi:hypothetical protein
MSVLAAAAAACVCFRMRDVRQFVRFAVVPAASALAWLGFFYVVYGTLNPTAPYGDYTQTTVSHFFRGFPALLFDQQFGLIPNAPVYGFILTGIFASALAFRRWSWEMLALVIPYMAAVGMYQMWWGGTSVPARLLTPLSLVLAVAAARIWHDSRTRATQFSGLVTLAASVLITAVLLGPDRGRLLFNFRDGVALWAEWANNALDLPRGLPSFFHDDPSRLRLKIAVWAASVLVGWLALRAVGSEPRQREGRTVVVTSTSIWCVAVMLMVAFTLAWRVDGASPLTPETSRVDLLRHASRFRPIAYDFHARRFEDPHALLAGLRIATDHQRRAVRPSTLLAARDVPAGTYELRLTAMANAEGTLALRIGDTTLPFLTASSAHAQSRPAEFPVRFPIGVRSISVDGDAAAVRSISAVELALARDDDATAIAGMSGTAHRAAHYQAADAFFLDENAYPEPTGFWVAGGRIARVIVGNSAQEFELVVRNAPVDNKVTIDVDDESNELSLGPGEERMVTLPKARRGPYRVLRIMSKNGFRPSEADPGNTDLRYLGCWVQSRQRTIEPPR